MPLVSSAIPNLVNGVSQQAPSLRMASQLEAQENAFSSVVEGLGKRSPSRHLKKLSPSDRSAAFFHPINRDATERYIVVCTDGDLKVYDLTGNEKTVAFPDGKTYLNTSTPNTVMRALTVQDYTFLLNTGKTVEMTSTVSDTALGKAIVTVKQGQYGTMYIIRIDGSVCAQYRTSDSSLDSIRTNNIAEYLKNSVGLARRTYCTNASFTSSTKQLTQTGAFTNYSWSSGDKITITSAISAAAGLGDTVKTGEYYITGRVSNDTITLNADITQMGANCTNVVTPDGPDVTTDYTFTVRGSTIYIQKNNGTAIDIDVEDSFGNRALTVAAAEVQRFSDLPTVAPAGFLTKITGDNTEEADDYYVKFVPLTTGQTFGNGNWVETVGPDVHTTLDASTMPHVLVREIDGTFTFKKADWGGRVAGDETTSPDPSFVGATLNDIFFFRNRLGLLSQENVILSVAGGFFKFFSQTVTSILDSDPVDVAATHTRASTLKYAIPFREELLLFSDQVQFVLTATGTLTPNSAVINPTTEFEASLRARPVGAGPNVYFAFARGITEDGTPRYSGVREYFVQKDSEAKDAADVTAHVPKYIPGTITKLAAATNEDIIAAFCTGDQAGFYVYKYYWVNDQKLQSSWSHYAFEANSKVLFGEFIKSTLYFAVQRADGLHLEVMSFEPGRVDEDSTYVTLLDRRLSETGVSVAYNSTTDRTTWTLPYTITSPMRVVTRAGNIASIPEGRTITLISQTGDTIVASGDLTTVKVYLGQLYTSRCRLSKPVIREEAKGGGQSVNASGTLKVRRYVLSFSNSGYFRVEVTPQGRTTSTKVFNSLVPGVNGLGSVNLRSGSFPFSVFADANEFTADIVSDSHLPFFLTGAEWEASFTSRSQRA